MSPPLPPITLGQPTIAAMSARGGPDPEFGGPLSELHGRLSRTAQYNLEIMKVNQVDAQILDKDIRDLLLNPIRQGFAFLGPGAFDRFRPEIDAVLQLILYKLTTYDGKPTPGQQMQNLKFRNEYLYRDERLKHVLTLPGKSDSATKAQRVLHGFLLIGTVYIWKRFLRFALVAGWADETETSWKKRVWTLVQRLETAVRTLSLVNFVTFLYTGRYPSLVDRILRMRMVYPNSQPVERSITFEYMNRQLLWETFTDVLSGIIPLVNTDRITSAFSSLVSHIPFMPSAKGNGSRQPVSLSCVICSAKRAFNPYIMNCRHIACYYCLFMAAKEDPNYKCSSCGKRLESSEPLTAAHLDTSS